MDWVRRRRLAGALACVAGCGVCCAQGPAEVKAVAKAATAPSGGKIFPLAEVRRGLHGVAYTVFEGVTPEPMEVEILGVLTDAIGPGQDMILGRLKGEKPEYTGVVAGMSGSPVYVDGKLLGALSYRIGQFSKAPICGITPIEQMFQVRDGGDAGGMRMALVDGVGSGQGQNANTGVLRSAQNDKFGGGLQNVAGGGEVQPIETALVFGGFSREAVERFGGGFRALGMSPVAGLGGAAAAGTKQPEPLVPGSAVSAVLVRGDLSISGTCTVTYVDATRLLACGHPITQYGPVSMPMTKAEVVATLASPLNAFKIINTTETVGSFTEDRASAILGRFGVDARMIPVSVEVVPEGSAAASPTHRDSAAMNGAPGIGGGTSQFSEARPGAPGVRVSAQVEGPKLTVPGMAPGLTGGMHFEVLNNRELTPQAMLVSVYQSLSGTNAAAAEISYRMSGELTLKGQPPVILRGIMAPNESNSGAIAAALYVNDRFGRLYSNSVEQPEVTGLRLRMEQIPERRTAVLEGARLGRTEVHAGETLDVEATLHPYQAEARVVHLAVKLPDSLPAGPMRVVVSDGATLDRLMTPVGAGFGGMTQHPIALGDAVAQMNRLHANDRIYVTLLDHSAMAELDAQALPEVPLSMANVLEPLKATQKMQLMGESVVEAGSMETGYAVSGTHVLNLEVR
jgi:SpoIVB peptidase S55